MSKHLKDITLAILILLCVASCVPRKKLIYLQPDNNIRNSTFYYDESDYRLKPNDVVGINVFSLTPEAFNFFGGAFQQFTIDDAGKVELPALGKVELGTLTLAEAEDKIQDLLLEYLKDPLVRVTLQTPFTFTILGEVNGPGTYTLVGQEPNIMEAISQAGDLTTFADRSSIRLIRKQGGEINIYRINALKDELLGSPFYNIKSEDILVVDPLPAKGVRENQLFLFSTGMGILTGLSFVLFRFF